MKSVRLTVEYPRQAAAGGTVAAVDVVIMAPVAAGRYADSFDAIELNAVASALYEYKK